MSKDTDDFRDIMRKIQKDRWIEFEKSCKKHEEVLKKLAEIDIECDKKISKEIAKSRKGALEELEDDEWLEIEVEFEDDEDITPSPEQIIKICEELDDDEVN